MIFFIFYIDLYIFSLLPLNELDKLKFKFLSDSPNHSLYVLLPYLSLCGSLDGTLSCFMPSFIVLLLVSLSYLFFSYLTFTFHVDIHIKEKIFVQYTENTFISAE